MSNLQFVINQKIQGEKESICKSCVHRFVCRAYVNQPCIECNYFLPERHERWVDEIDPWDRQHLGKCSECGKKYHDFEYFRYCPNCGAKMDGKDRKMDKYIKYSDIPFYEIELEERCHNERWTEIHEVAYKTEIDQIPAADVAPVVRCKDCKKGIPDSEHATAYGCYGIWHKPDWFCAGGMRKSGDGE